MMELRSDVLTTLYAQGASIAFVIGLLALSVHLRKRQRTEAKLFSAMCYIIVAMSIFLSINVLLRYRTFPGVRQIALISMTLSELTIVLMLYQWIIFLDYLIYRSRDHIGRHVRAIILPVFIEAGLYLINLFTALVFKFGIIFDVDENMVYTRGPVFPVVKLIEFSYMVASVILIVRYRKSSKTPSFIKISPFLIPIVIGACVSIFTDYSAHSLGFAVGLVLLNFSLMNGYCYVDDRLGCYNRAYLSYIGNLTVKKGFTGGTGILFNAGDKIKEFSEILLEEKPKNTDLVYMGKGRFLIVAETQRKSSIKLFINLIEEAAEEKGLEFTAHYGIRNNDEDPSAFLERILKMEE